MRTETPLMTAEEFFEQYGSGGYELIDGRVVETTPTGARKGSVGSNTAYQLQSFLERTDLGHGFSNDTLFVLRKNPDTLRGPDLCYASYKILPTLDEPDGPLRVAPEVTFEILSPSDVWSDVVATANEYMKTGVQVAIVLDPQTQTATIFRPNSAPQNLEANDELTIPDHLPGFAVPVRRFFE